MLNIYVLICLDVHSAPQGPHAAQTRFRKHQRSSVQVTRKLQTGREKYNISEALFGARRSAEVAKRSLLSVASCILSFRSTLRAYAHVHTAHTPQKLEMQVFILFFTLFKALDEMF